MAQLKESVVYKPCPDATPKAELNVLAHVFRFIFDCHAKKKVVEPTPELDGPDGTRLLGDSTDAQIISR
jgi:hypothetical protein